MENEIDVGLINSNENNPNNFKLDYKGKKIKIILNLKNEKK